MRTQEHIIGLLRPYPGNNKLRSIDREKAAFEFYEDLFFLYREEFGEQWTNKELKLAKKVLVASKSKMINGSIADTLEIVYESLEEDVFKISQQWFIGVRQVSPENFCYYSKGLYWMAAYQMKS